MTPTSPRAAPATGTLAVIIVSYNVRVLRSCLSATFACLSRTETLRSQVWVVDNASADGSGEMVAGEFPEVRLIASPVNLGFAGANNLALRRLGFPDGPACSELVLLLNPDAEPLGDAIGRMAGFLAAQPAVGGAAASLRYADGRFQHGAFRFPGLWQLWLDLFPPRPYRLLESRVNGRYPRRLYAAGRPFEVDFGLGAALMVRGEAIKAAGLLDEGYFMYAEEVDWCWRMRRAGWSVYCVPLAEVIHHGGASSGQYRTQSFLNLWLSRRRLYGRYYGPLRRKAAGLIVRLGMRRAAQRTRVAVRDGALSPAVGAQRIQAAQRVAELFAERLTGHD